MSAPNEKWLVVVHKEESVGRDIDAAIRRLLPEEVKPNVATITWGRHMATNAFKDAGNVCLAGTLFQRDSSYVSLHHLCQARDVARGLATVDEVRKTIQGEHYHNVLQALSRGRIRQSDGSRCQPMAAWIIASTHSGIPDALPMIFPNCKVRSWQPFGAAKAEHFDEAVAFVRQQRDAGLLPVTYKAIQEAINVRSNNFAKLVTSRPEWLPEMAALGLEPYGGAKRTRGLRAIDRHLNVAP